MLSDSEKNDIVEKLVEDSLFDISSLRATNAERIEIAHKLMDHPKFDVSSPRGGAVFYGGNIDFKHSHQVTNQAYFLSHEQIPSNSDGYPGRGESRNRELADLEIDRDLQHITRLERTPGGRALFHVLEGVDPYADATTNQQVEEVNDAVKEISSVASKKYAQAASGNARAYVVGSTRDGTFEKVELPALLKNSAVTSVEGVPREQLADIFKNDPDLAMDHIRRNELGRNRSRAVEHGDIAALRDVDEQDRLYGDQSRRWAPDVRRSRDHKTPDSNSARNLEQQPKAATIESHSNTPRKPASDSQSDVSTNAPNLIRSERKPSLRPPPSRRFSKATDRGGHLSLHGEGGHEGQKVAVQPENESRSPTAVSTDRTSTLRPPTVHRSPGPPEMESAHQPTARLQEQGSTSQHPSQSVSLRKPVASHGPNEDTGKKALRPPPVVSRSSVGPNLGASRSPTQGTRSERAQQPATTPSANGGSHLSDTRTKDEAPPDKKSSLRPPPPPPPPPPRTERSYGKGR